MSATPAIRRPMRFVLIASPAAFGFRYRRAGFAAIASLIGTEWGAVNGLRSVGARAAVARSAAGLLRFRGAAAPSRLVARGRGKRRSVFHAGAAAESPRRRPVESRAARACRSRIGDAALQPGLRPVRGDHGPPVLGAGGVQLPGARRAEHDRAAELR